MAKKSAIKRNRQNLGRRMRNRMSKSTIKTAVKKFLSSVDAKDKAVASADFQLVQKLLDTASGKGIVHSNLVARRKSRLAQKLNALGN